MKPELEKGYVLRTSKRTENSSFGIEGDFSTGADFLGGSPIRHLPAFVLLLIAFAARSFAADSPSNFPSATATSGGGPVVTTLAGTNSVGFVDATGIYAVFSNPNGVAADSSGNVYVADYGNNLIRKITPAGVVTSLAGLIGSYGFGSKDGVGTAATFYGPNGVAVDSSGNIYVADSVNCLVRKVTPGGVVTTLAGSGTAGKSDGTGNAASFNDPYSVAVDSSGNVYVADYGNNLIRKITPTGVVTTLAGSAGVTGATNATGTTATFNGPTGLAVDASGNVYVADSVNCLIRKITSAGVVTTLAGSPGVAGSRNGKDALFKDPSGIALDSSGNLYVADAGNSLIRKITPAGLVTTLAGSAGVTGATNGIGTAALFYGPFGVTVDASGNVYVADAGNGMIRKIAP